MRRISSYVALLGMLFLWSCEEETLEPRTNPRFSVTIVQEISSSGVQFGADIYDYGNEEILEYGFVYTQSTGAPNLNQDDYVAIQGRPGEHFELVANHSMTVGKKYFVSAFLRTSTAIVFSKSIEFVSQGSEGFIINSVEWPELIYKAQNLVVKGRRFSKQRANYKVKLGQFDLYPNLVDSTTLMLPLPEGILTQTTGQDIEMELRIEINEKVYTERKVLKFQEPVFESQELQLIDFNEEVSIKGQFLDLGTITLRIGTQILSGLRAGQNELRFFPHKGTSIKPINGEVEITYEARGISYPLGKIFKVNGPKIESNKVVLSTENPVIPAVNFNLENSGDIQFLDEKGEIINLEIVKSDISGITINTIQSIYPGRKFRTQIRSRGLVSNFVDIEVINPVVKIQAKTREFAYDTSSPALVSGDFAYVLSSQGVIRESLDGKFIQQKVADLPFTSRWLVISQVVEGGFIYGGGLNDSSLPVFDIYFFDLQTQRWSKLPNLPEPYNSFQTVTSKDGNLIFEQAINYSNEVEGERWKLNLQSKTWEKLPASIGKFIRFQTFNQNGETYLYGLENLQENKALYRMRADFTWERYLEIPREKETPDFFAPVLIGSKYYILSNYSYVMEEIDLIFKSFKPYSMPFHEYSAVVPVVGKGSIFILSNHGFHIDIRLDLF
ncbi:kelch repeat-containing protein [Algoriphagus litoralis]|uniref:kelch repeat-containing protein n=1 Tax=Algoriphagus litoralis TaxID=2202829 RepID=UPI000DB90F4E|nr:kelch repeat-containing protein [Algoriphagus litoralis]